MPSPVLRLLAQDLRRIGPGVLNGPTAAKVGVSVAVPLLALMATDHLEWSAFCAFGAFAAVYGRALTRRARARQQAQAGAALVVAVTVGTIAALSAHPTFWIVVGGSITAMLMAVLADVADWKPGGGLFALFGFAVCATQADASWSTVLIAAALSTATAAFATAVGCLGPAGTAPAPDHRLAERLRRPSTMRHAVRHLIAPLLTGSVAVALDIGHPYWGMVASIVPLTSPSLREMAFRGVHRLIGTALGLILTAVILAFDPSSAALVVVIIVAQVVTELTVMRNYALALVFITPLALLMGQLVHPLPATDVVVQRGVEMLIGVVIGLGVAWATRRRPQAKSLSPQ
ncbi:FUSC family protein [Aeromicrobium wangtongii]|uniref:FUSC family protein n=1 Tax=Aeromicrobium wangtongii TaxID=2969247 RepID=UPI002016BC76|nr:FUSC family protein [Aeromicrobium wangtongii]MCL3819768.1 FUSC family protein [Aeromicrobium wangtongii]